MPTRKETTERKFRLMRDLRLSSRDGAVGAGDMALSQRELARRYGLSMYTVGQLMQQLVEEGALHTVPRVGTFIGAPVPQAGDYYLVLLPSGDDAVSQQRHSLMCAGFEERIAQLGGSALCLLQQRARDAHDAGVLPPLAGVWEIAWEDAPFWFRERGEIPRVRLHGGMTAQRFDTVSFDDADGGRKATEHLMARGHRDIAFVALHPENSAEPLWSRERQAGWQRAMENAGLSAENVFHPGEKDLRPDERLWASKAAARQAGRAASRKLATRLLRGASPITAVVAANDAVALGVLDALEQVPTERWPAVVGFDDTSELSPHLLTSLRLPWNELGKAAADVLWKRRHGKLTDEPHSERVPMKLIARLTCRRDWPRRNGSVALATAQI